MNRKLRFMGLKGTLEDDPSSRQSLISGWNQDLIKNSRILIVGIGALGNEILKNLVLLGVGYIRLVDNDVVEGSNLSRSVLFTKEDAITRRPKVEAAADSVRRVDPYGYIKVDPINTDIMDHMADSSIYNSIDVVVTSLDNLEARLHVNSIAYQRNIPLVDGGMDGAMGHVQTVIPPYTSCLYCSVTDRDYSLLADKLSCEGLPLKIGEPKVPAVITTTALIASIMTHEIIKIIHGIDKYRKTREWDEKLGAPLAGKRLFVNLANNTFLIYEVPKSSTCPFHS